MKRRYFSLVIMVLLVGILGLGFSFNPDQSVGDWLKKIVTKTKVEVAKIAENSPTTRDIPKKDVSKTRDIPKEDDPVNRADDLADLNIGEDLLKKYDFSYDKERGRLKIEGFQTSGIYNEEGIMDLEELNDIPEIKEIRFPAYSFVSERFTG